MNARGQEPRPSLLVRLAVNVPIALAIVAVVLYRFGAIQTLRVSSVNMVPTLEPVDHVMVRAYGREPVLGDVVVYRSPFDRGHLQVGRIVGAGGNRVELTEDGLHLDGKPAAVPVPADCGDTACETAGKDEAGGCGIAAAEPAVTDSMATDSVATDPAATAPAPAAEPACADAGSLVGAEAVGDRRFFTRRASGLPALLFEPVTVPAEHFFVLSDNRVDERDSRIYGAIPHHAIVGVLSFVYYAADETGIRWDRLTRRVS